MHRSIKTSVPSRLPQNNPLILTTSFDVLARSTRLVHDKVSRTLLWGGTSAEANLAGLRAASEAKDPVCTMRLVQSEERRREVNHKLEVSLGVFLPGASVIEHRLPPLSLEFQRP